MGTELAPVKMNKPVTWVDPKAMNRDVGKRYLARVASASRSPFVGRQVRPNGKDGFLQVGFGDNAVEHDDMTVVINVPQTLATWQYWPEDEGPTYPYIDPIFGGGAGLPTRAQCGPEETKYNELKKEDEDVWKEGLVLILRDPKSNELMHLTCFGNVNAKAGEFVLSLADAPEIDNGKLPLVKLSFEKIKLKNKSSFYGIKFELVEWVKAIKADLPTAIASAQEADEDDEAPKSRGKSRRDEPEDDEAEEAPRGRKSSTPKFDRHAERDSSRERERDRNRDEDGAEDDEKPARGKSRREEPEDDEDDKPRMVSRSSVKGKSKVEDDEDEKPARGKSRREEPEDDEDEPRPVRRRRPALN